VKINTIAKSAAVLADVWAVSGNTAMMRNGPKTKCVINAAAVNREGTGKGTETGTEMGTEMGREMGIMAQVVDA
jgi:hypothetical protein